MTSKLSHLFVALCSLPTLAALPACHDESAQSTVDMAAVVTEDMTIIENGDLAAPPADLSGSDGSVSHGDLASPDLRPPHVYTCRGLDAPGTLYKGATSAIRLPTTAKTYALDLDGDGRADNQLKSILQTLSLVGLTPQAEIDSAVAAGTIVYLAGVTTAATDNSTCAGVTLHFAKPRGVGDPSPKYDGTDVFTPDVSLDAELTGKITAGVLTTTLPTALTSTSESRIDLNLSVLGMKVSLPLRGTHLQGTLMDVGGKLSIQNAELHGAVNQKDIDGTLVPAVATLVTQLINGDPTSTTSATLINLFENTANAVSATKCMVAKDCCHTSPSTCKILPDEIKISLVGNVLKSDIHAFGTADEWAPATTGTKNGLSIGVGIGTVPASW